ncbi:Met-10+ like-protein-domain-containing protein [Syncephalis plumigaleata]|nr:Met-10+ like-protein-domain-containing protein [Syncephalis plumigaleata]
MLTPPVHRSMTELSREAFRKTIQLLALRVPVKSIGHIRQTLEKDLFNQPRLRNVVSDPSQPDRKLLLLKQDITDINDNSSMSNEARELIEREKYDVVTHELEIDYDYWTADEILSAILPEDMVVPGSFETVGHIAHMNLRDEFLPYKQLIGQVILDKNPRIKSVVNKTDTIDTTFRFFKMEVLAGIDDMVAEVREIYWNSRLHTEHSRLISLFKKNERICDVFAGVGPFAVPAAKRGNIVYANDLNPESYKYLNENREINKVTSNLHTFNLDGREFIRSSFTYLAQADKKAGIPFRPFEHVAMNLPATAIEFVDAFRGILVGSIEDTEEEPKHLNTTIHCYCFSKSDDPETDVVERIGAVLQEPLQPGTYTVFNVRRVAPNKVMLCVSFKLSKSVAFAR